MEQEIAVNRRWSREAFAGGIMQALCVAALLFVPTPVNCLWEQIRCEPHSLIPFANATTYLMLGTLGIFGLLVAGTSHDKNLARRGILRWFGAAVSACLTIITIYFGPGLLFLPGTVLILIAAFTFATH